MWVWIIAAVAVAAVVVWALWPRRRGVSDAAVLSARQSTIGGMEQHENTNRRHLGGGF